MALVALITLLMLLQYLYFMIAVGQARGKDSVQAPAVSGGENFELANRVHLNTLEQLVMALPAMWLSAQYFRADVAAILGAAFVVGRALYSAAYKKEPKSRATGFLIGFLAIAGMLLTAAYGVVIELV